MATEKNAAQHLHEFHKAAHEHHSEMIAAHKTETWKSVSGSARLPRSRNCGTPKNAGPSC